MAHGYLRGLTSTPRSESLEGRFGRMFRALQPATYGKTDAETTANLMLLGAAMESSPDLPKDGKDPEESGIPSLYTYFGQFIDHDLTLGPEGSFQKVKDVDAMVDYRTPAFDLDCVYGRGPDDQPYLYANDGKSFLLGSEIHGGSAAKAVDLPRNTPTNPNDPARALIGDPRNDENSIVSQLQCLFLGFHNRLLADNPGMSFERAQRELQRHYQYVVLNDFLPNIIDAGVLKGLKTGPHFDEHKLRFYRPKKSPFMPVEFSTAAYRFGHSMIRPGYRLNGDNLLAIFAPTKEKDLRGKYAMDKGRGIDWGRLIDTDIRAYDGGSTEIMNRLQFAYRIDASLVNPLAHLPPNVASNPASLAQRNLLRSVDLALPTGQAVARAMHLEPLRDDQIILQKAVDIVDIDPADPIIPIADLKGTNGAFKGNCPLWTYILAEAAVHQTPVTIPVAIPASGKAISITTPRLGPVGGRIVAEVFLGLMFGDPTSLLSTNPAWTPASGANYRLKDFVLYAIGKEAAKGAGQ